MIRVNVPYPPMFDPYGNFMPAWLTWFNYVTDRINDLTMAGTTAERPVKGLWIGRPYFDTTLGFEIRLKTISPIVWVDGSGASV